MIFDARPEEIERYRERFLETKGKPVSRSQARTCVEDLRFFAALFGRLPRPAENRPPEPPEALPADADE